MAVPKKRKSVRKTRLCKIKFFNAAWHARARANHALAKKRNLRSRYKWNIQQNVKRMSTTSVRRIKPYRPGFKPAR